MKIFPAIDLYGGKAVRLYKGDYSNMTVYSDDPISIAKDFEASGAECIHIVDLEGARLGGTPNFETVRRIAENTSLFCEVGGGIRSREAVERYLGIGLGRVILGTAAVNDEKFLISALERYGERIAVGADIRDGKIAVKGWLERSEYDVYSFFERMQSLGVKTVICTDVSKDGAMQGTNLTLYRELSKRYSVGIVASGGVSSLSDVKALSEMSLEGAIIGKAYYTGDVNLKEAIALTK